MIDIIVPVTIVGIILICLVVITAGLEKQTKSGKSKKKGAAPADAGVRHLVRLGRLDEAIDIYREFTGVSLEEAQEAISQIDQEVGLESDDENHRADRADDGRKTGFNR
jgi:hypothetical protein